MFMLKVKAIFKVKVKATVKVEVKVGIMVRISQYHTTEGPIPPIPRHTPPYLPYLSTTRSRENGRATPHPTSHTHTATTETRTLSLREGTLRIWACDSIHEPH